MKKAIILFSGGLDSCVSATIAKTQGYELNFLFFDYGQKSVKNEKIASQKISKILGAKLTVIKLDWMKNFKSGLTTATIPKVKFEELNEYEKMKHSASQVWIPARNLIFCSIAAGFAENLDADAIFTGFNKEEAKTFPDNSKNFVENFNTLLNFAVLKKKKPHLIAPLIDSEKPEIVKIGNEINAPMHLSYSCYSDGEIHCGECESCLRRKRAFMLANVEDKTKYKK